MGQKNLARPDHFLKKRVAVDSRDLAIQEREESEIP